jgi:hypothetical protein
MASIHDIAAELEVERRLRRVGGAVDEQQRALRREGAHFGGMLVADVNLQAGLRRVDHRFFRGQLRGLSVNSRRACSDAGSQNRSNDATADHDVPSLCLCVSTYHPARALYASPEAVVG